MSSSSLSSFSLLSLSANNRHSQRLMSVSAHAYAHTPIGDANLHKVWWIVLGQMSWWTPDGRTDRRAEAARRWMSDGKKGHLTSGRTGAWEEQTDGGRVGGRRTSRHGEERVYTEVEWAERHWTGGHYITLCRSIGFCLVRCKLLWRVQMWNGDQLDLIWMVDDVGDFQLGEPRVEWFNGCCFSGVRGGRLFTSEMVCGTNEYL